MSRANSATLLSSEKTRKRVKRGAKLLDRVGPVDWFWRVDLDDLDLGCCYSCVLGQLYGDYRDGIIKVAKGELDLGNRYGFDIPCSDMYGPTYHEWLALTELWRERIIARREEVTGMNIGEEQPAIVVEPIDVPSEVPDEKPAEPVKVPEKETVPA